MQQRHEVDASGEIIKLPTYAPWKEHLYDLEEDLRINPSIKFCLYEVRCRRTLWLAAQSQTWSRLRANGVHWEGISLNYFQIILGGISSLCLVH